ncbi:DEAD/DEAH box helicase [Leucobacter albus]|uniref:DEAD/DEAH box helicase n=1 Tax=Leucobacter albus TaxID=272210 RepID=UPI0031CF28BE
MGIESREQQPAGWRAQLAGVLGEHLGAVAFDPLTEQTGQNGWPNPGAQAAQAGRPEHSVRPAQQEQPEQLTELGLLFELRELMPRSSESWNGPLSRALPTVGRLRTGEERPGTGVVRLATRPAMRTARGWARGSLTWANIGHHGSRLRLDPEQQRWFRQFHALHRAAEPLAVGQDPQWVLLDDFVSPALWAMLTQAQTLGIALAMADRRSEVVLHERAELTLDVVSVGGEHSDDDAAGRSTAETPLPPGLRVAPLLLLDGDAVALPGEQLASTETTLGQARAGTPAPAGASMRVAGATASHGLYVVERADTSGSGGSTASTVRLAPVPAGLSENFAALLAAGGAGWPITVPERERAAFLDVGVRALRSRFELSSSDGSVALPKPQADPPVLTAAWRRGHRLTLRWHTESRAPLAEALPPQLGDDERIPPVWLVDPHPPEVELRDAEAAVFLAEVLPQLEQLPGIEVHKTGSPPTYRELRGAPELQITAVPSETEDWFDMGVLVVVDGRTVPFRPLFRALAANQRRLLLVDGTYLQLNHPTFTPLIELIAEAQNLAEWEAGFAVPRHQVPRWADFVDLAEESPAATQWRALIAEVGEQSPVAVPVPASVRAELRSYQLEGFHWLAFLWRHRLGGILADDMGLGKTLQCLTLIAHAKAGSGAMPPAPLGAVPSVERRPFLVVAPTSVMTNWASEAAKFVPGLRVSVRSSTSRASRRPVSADAAVADIIVTSYALFRLDFEEYRSVAADPERGFAGLILDEAQFVKNAQAQGNELARELPVSWKLAVTGTPMENSLRELHAICGIVAPGLFPSARRFEERYVRAIERPAPGVSEGIGAGSGPQTQAALRAHRTKELRRRLRPFLLRRTKPLVAAELPERQEQLLEIELAPEHRELYEVFLQRERQKLFGLIDDLDRHRFTVLRSLTLLRMLALDASLIDETYADLPSAKLDALTEHTSALASEGRRALVFSQFTSLLALARERLTAAGLRVALLDGSTRNRDSVIGQFRRGGVDVFLISLKAGGVGLNLAEADTVFLLDPWWNPASEAQAIDRAHRIGQGKQVHVIRLIALGTIEEKVRALQARKRAVFDAVIDNEAHFAAGLTASDLRDLLGAGSGETVS